MKNGLDNNGAAVTGGSNIVVVSYDLLLPTNHPVESTIINTASVTNYAGSESGPNHIPGGRSDDAEVMTPPPSFVKTVTGTEITGTGNGAFDAAIGELVTYSLAVTVPEGLTTNAVIEDMLVEGLAFVQLVSTTPSTNVTVANNPATVTILDPGTARQVRFTLGDIQNNSTTNSGADTVTLVFTAVVLNQNTLPASPGNQAGVTLGNTATFTYSTNGTLASTPAQLITIVEPTLSLTKQIAPDNGGVPGTFNNTLTLQDAGNTNFYQIVITHAGGPAAFDLGLDDTFNAKLASPTLYSATSSSASTNGSPAVLTTNDFQVSGQTLNFNPASNVDLAPGGSITVVVSVTLALGLNPAEVIGNTGTVTWTSLDGDFSAVRTANNASSTERSGAGGVGTDAAVLNNYAARNGVGTGQVTADAPLLSKFVVASSEAHTLEPLIIADFTATGFDGWTLGTAFTGANNTWDDSGNTTNLPQFLRIGNTATERGGGYFTYTSPNYLDLRGYNTVSALIRANTSNAATPLWIQLTDADGTVFQLALATSPTAGLQGFSQSVSASLLAPTTIPTTGTTAGLDLARITQLELRGDNGNNAMRMDIDRIVALRTLAVPGEIVRYRLVVQLPEGTSPDLCLEDAIPTGMRFINDGTVRAAFVANGGGIASSAVGIGAAAVPALTGTGLNLSGSGDDVSSFSLATSGTNGLAIGETTGFDATVASSRTDATLDTYNDSTDVFFRLGTLVNSDTDADAEYVVLEFNALVSNDRNGNASDGSAQQAGANLSNTFQTRINSSTGNTQVNANLTGNDFQAVVIVEPQINNLGKSLLTAPTDAGDAVSYEIRFANDTAHPAQYAPRVRVATTASFAAAFNAAGGAGGTGRYTSAPTVIDGVTLANDDRVLVKNQGTASQNGIYRVVDAATGIWDRTMDFDTAAEMTLGYRAYATAGTANSGRTYALDVAVTTINTDTLAFSEVPGNPSVSAASTGNLAGFGAGTFTGVSDTQDGITLSVGDRVLVRAQGTRSQNGVYVVTSAGGGTMNMSRAADFSAVTEFPIGIQVYVAQGNRMAGRTFAQTANVTTINTSNIDWALVEQVTAFDLALTDVLSTNVLFQSVTVVSPDGTTNRTTSGAIPGGTVTVPAVGATGTVIVAINALAPAAWLTGPVSNVTVTINGTIATAADARTEFVNTARLAYTSLPGTNGTAANPTGTDPTTSASVEATGLQFGERNGSGVTATDNTRVNYDGVSSNRNNYSVGATLVHTLARPTVDKAFQDGSLTADDTSVGSSSGADVVIGEDVTFDILVTLPEGSTRALRVDEILPAGLRLDSWQVLTNAVDADQLTADFNGTLAVPTVAPGLPVTGAQTVTYDFSNTVVAADNNISNNAFVIRLQTTVLNVAGNQDGVTRTNATLLRYDGALTGETVPDAVSGNNPVVTVREPVLAIDKSVVPTLASASNTVTYTIVITNTSAQTAYDLALEDALPAKLTSPTLTLNPGGDFEITVLGGTNVVRVIPASTNNILPGGSLKIEVEGTLDITVEAGETIVNTAFIEWTSTPGVNADERDGSDGSGGPLNDYATSDPASLFIRNATIDKQWRDGTISADDTSLVSSTGTNVVIGETVTYDILVTLPEGQTTALVIRDHVPAGLRLDSYQLITNAVGSALLTTNYFGTITNAPTVSLPAAGPATVNFAFGNTITTPDSNSTNDSFVLRVAATVQNIVGNQAGTNLANTADVQYNVPGVGVRTVSDSDPTNNPVVTVREPVLTLDKSVLPLLADSTNTVTYTFVITNTSDQVAYDLALADWLPLLVESPTLTINPGADFEIANVGGTNLLRVIPANTVDLGVGASLSIEVQGTVSTNALPGANVTNAALIGWTSLPGANADERDGNDGPGGALDDYATANDAVFTVYTHAISGYVYEDDNNDGVRDPSESDVSSVTVTLTGTDHIGNPVTLVTTTDVNGFYAFTGLRPGTYTVTKTQPDGYLDGKETSGSPWAGAVNNATISHTISTIVIPTGTPSTNGTEYNFGLRGPGSIGDRVWLDENSDGIQDAGEDGIANVTVRLYDDTGTNLLTETVTDTEGNYLFPGLIAGDYGVRIVTSSMSASLAANPTYDLDGIGTAHVTDVTLAAGENRVDADFGYNWSAPTDVINGTGTGAIGDRIWIDSNGDGVQDPGEAGLAGIEVRIYYDANTNGMYTNLFTAAVDQNGITGTGITTNGADGRYVFDALPAGAYVIVVNGGVTPGTYTQTGDPDFFGQNLPGGEDDNQTTMPIILAPGDVFVNADFGYQPTSDTALSGTVYFDSDANESLDGPDYGIRSVTVALLDTNGVVIATTRTATNGFYRFTGLQAGEYTVWVNDTGNLLGELTQTEDQDLARDGRHTVTLNGIADVTGIDFGYTPAEHAAGNGLVGDRIWLDLDGDGVQDTSEPGLEAITVRLYDSTGTNLLETAVTDANGNYAFGGLATNSVTYIVRVDTNSLPNGGVGLVNTYDPNTLSPGDNQSSVTLTGAAPIDLDQDFGYNATVPNTIGGTIWEDRNADGTLVGSETNYFEGVTVLLADTNGNVVATTVTDANGDYLFTGLPDGTYRVDVTDTANVLNGYWHSDGPNDGSNNNSQVDPYTVGVSGGATNTTGDFGYYVDAAALGNRVWLDANINGIQDAGEVGMTNTVLLRLTIAYDNGITNVVSTLSYTNGFYSFGNLLLDEHQNGTNTASPVFTISAINPGTNFNHTIFNHSGTPVANDSDRPSGVIATTIQGVTGVSLNGEDPYAPSNEISQAWYDFGFSLTPTLAVITGVRSRIEDGVAVISWDVSLEIGTVGYALDRWVDGAWQRISGDWIMADLITSGTKTYEQRDPDAPVGSVQRYQIVELDTMSRQLYYGPYDLKLDGGEISYATWVAGIVWGSVDSAPNADPDRDGLTNWQEYLAGTDPISANSVLRVSSLDRIPEGIRLSWPSVGGRFYAIEMAPSLGVAFQAVVTDIQDTEPENVYVVPVPPEYGQQGFYRVIVKEVIR